MPSAFRDFLRSDVSANDYELADNCYYCSVAALLGQTVDGLFRTTELMQIRGGASLDETLMLFHAAGEPNIGVRMYVVGEEERFADEILNTLPAENAVGLAYERQDGTGHMVVLARNGDGATACIDYQSVPPALAQFPPEDTIARLFIFYREAPPTPSFW